jgi:HPr kinase/phosphorylase
VIEVAELAKETTRRCKLQLVAGQSGLNRTIRQMDLHRPGLALAGFVELFPAERIQILGNTEMLYLRHLNEVDRRAAIERLFGYALPCVIVTNRNDPTALLMEYANLNAVPLFVSRLNTTELTFYLSNYLTDRFAPTESVHGTLVDVYGTGLLFVGRAGIGKSEIALDLVERGHRLVADDVVVLTRKAPGVLVGTGPEMLRHLFEIRGIGVIDVRQMFGVRAIRLQKRVETVVELKDWDNSENYERLGLDNLTREYLGINIPLIQLPIYPGKNITVLIEAISLSLHLKVYGHNAAHELAARQAATMKQKRLISEYLRWDKE